MTDLLAARTQMAMSLGFHILFAVAGMAMPVLMLVAEWGHKRTGDPVLRELARRWATGTAILFAVGAVSGTVLSFELGLLWPTFMEHAGPLIGLPFSLEGFAFFLEAIFLGICLYGWDRVSPNVHLFAGVMVALSGLASGVFVVGVNAWMNAPAGFGFDGTSFTHIDPWGPFKSPAFPTQASHMALAAYTSVSCVVLGIHAAGLLKTPDSAFHKAAVRICFWTLAVTMPLQILTGDLSAKHIAKHQPAKLAAAKAHFHTEKGASLAIGGWPDVEARELRYAIKIPKMLSFMAFADFDAEVKGLDQVPREDWPPVAITHISFQVMVACGFAMLGLVGLGLFLRWRRGPTEWTTRPFLRLATLCAPLGLIAVEAGWFVTEVGRQPWIIHGIMRTKDAVTPMPNLPVPLIAFTLLYVLLGVIVIILLRNHVTKAPR